MNTPRENPFLARAAKEQTKTMSKGDQGSRGKAEKASERSNSEIISQENTQASWPLGVSGKPMMKAEMSASELIPTGQYANVAIGPCRLHFLIDPDRQIEDGQSYFSPEQRATIAAALNEAAEIVEGDVVAVQRSIVLESMQQQLNGDHS